MDLSPSEGVLLRKAHACADGDDELCKMLRETAFNSFVELVVLLAAQEAEPPRSLAPVPNLPGRVDAGLAIVEALAVAEGNKGFVAVAGGRCLAMGAKPAFDILRPEVVSRTRAEGVADDLGY